MTSLPPSSSSAPVVAVRSVPTLTLEGAKICSEATEVMAKQLGIAINIAIADHTTFLLHFVRMNNAKLTSIDIAIDKAFTSAGHRNPTSYYTELSKEDGKAFGLPFANKGRFSILAGGLPILDADGNCIGGIGASGGSPDQDVQCVTAGIDAFNQHLKQTLTKS